MNKNEAELFSENLTWVLRAQTNSAHYTDFMAVDLLKDNTAVLRIGGKRYPFEFESLPDLLAQVVDILGSPTLPESEPEE